MFRNLIAAAAIASVGILAPLSLTVAPVANAIPCRAIPAPGCNPNEQADDPMKPREAKGGKTGPRSSGNPSNR